MRALHENPETAGAKMSALCSFCVHHVAVNGEAVNSNSRDNALPGIGKKYFPLNHKCCIIKKITYFKQWSVEVSDEKNSFCGI